MNIPRIKQAAELLKKSQGTVAFTGAGLSTRSGIPDFRSPKTGLWAQIDLSQSDESHAGSIHGFPRDPQAFYNRFGPLVKKIFYAEPNPAHFALAKLENAGHIKTIITQNADLLHQRAGSQQVIEVHGSLAEARTAGVPGCPRAARTHRSGLPGRPRRDRGVDRGGQLLRRLHED